MLVHELIYEKVATELQIVGARPNLGYKCALRRMVSTGTTLTSARVTAGHVQTHSMYARRQGALEPENKEFAASDGIEKTKRTLLK